MNEIVYREESYRIMGAGFEVYREKGCGFLEAVYQECLELEFGQAGVPFLAHPRLELRYKGFSPKQIYTPNFICFEQVVIELKAISALADEHRAQVHNYLHANGLRLGILINFGHFPKVESERIVV